MFCTPCFSLLSWYWMGKLEMFWIVKVFCACSWIRMQPMFRMPLSGWMCTSGLA